MERENVLFMFPVTSWKEAQKFERNLLDQLGYYNHTVSSSNTKLDIVLLISCALFRFRSQLNILADCDSRWHIPSNCNYNYSFLCLNILHFKSMQSLFWSYWYLFYLIYLVMDNETQYDWCEPRILFCCRF